jgi:hypothetical protein
VYRRPVRANGAAKSAERPGGNNLTIPTGCCQYLPAACEHWFIKPMKTSINYIYIYQVIKMYRMGPPSYSMSVGL